MGMWLPVGIWILDKVISHPVWDERILTNDISPDSWVDGYEVPAEAIAFDNEAMFCLRKRQFFFFNKDGKELNTNS